MIDKEEFARKIISEYIYQNDVSTPVEVHFVENINDSWKLYTKDIKVINQYSNDDFSKYNGLLMPYDGVGYHILIRNDYKDYECTIIHESTHVIDYDNFRVIFNNGNKDIEFHPYYWYMALYSEFHARSVAHSYYCFEQLPPDCDKMQTIIDEVINIVPLIKDIENQIRNTKSVKERQNLYYELMQLLGRIYITKLDISSLDDFSENIKNLYSCLVALNKEWNDSLFQSFGYALKQLNY